MYVILAAAAFLFASLSHARMDPKTIVAVWLFDEGKDDEAKDSSENGHHGIIKGGAKWVPGKFDGALEFNGVDGFVEVQAADDLNLQTFTVVAWFKISKISAGMLRGFLVAKQGEPFTRTYGFSIEADGQILYGFSSDVGTGNYIKSTVTLLDGQWHNVAMSYDGKVLRGYADGELKAENDFSSVPDLNGDHVTIGKCIKGQFVKGIIDEVGIFNVALVADDIKSIMNKGLGSATGLTAVEPSGMVTTWGSIREQQGFGPSTAE